MKISIEKGIPVPPRKGRPEVNLYPFGEMEMDDSFFLPNVHKDFSIHPYVREYNRLNIGRQIRVTQRREFNGVRIWRIE